MPALTFGRPVETLRQKQMTALWNGNDASIGDIDTRLARQNMREMLY
jgi:hypothetical protein